MGSLGGSGERAVAASAAAPTTSEIAAPATTTRTYRDATAAARTT
ncbi:MAG: hypothetical protein U0S48_13075 [Solirubrobacteraceae bacterium]